MSLGTECRSMTPLNQCRACRICTPLRVHHLILHLEESGSLSLLCDVWLYTWNVRSLLDVEGAIQFF